MEIIQFLEEIINANQAMVLVALLIAQLATGSVVAAIKGEFELNRFIDFHRKVSTTFVIYLGVSVAAVVMTDWLVLQTAAYAGLIAMIVDKILKNLKDADMPVPDGIPFVNGLVNRIGSIAGKQKKKS